MTDNVISALKLSKRYAPHAPYALKDLTLSVRRGEIYGFLGPNGAGKSTTIRTLLNFIQPTSGSAEIFGKDIIKDSIYIRQSIGYLSGDFNAYEKMTSSQFLDYMDSLLPAKKQGYKIQLIKTFKLNLHKKISDLSKGNKQKIGIIQAMMHQPELLILDEPTDGLDPLMQEEFYKLVREMKSNGTTVFISSHNLSEVKKICDRVGIIKDGQLVREYAIAELATEASQTFEVSFSNKVTATELKKITGVQKVQSRGNVSFSIHVHNNLTPLLGFLAKQSVTSLSTKELNLEEQFMKYYESKGSR